MEKGLVFITGKAPGIYNGKGILYLSWEKDIVICPEKRELSFYMGKGHGHLSWEKGIVICHGKKELLFVMRKVHCHLS